MRSIFLTIALLACFASIAQENEFLEYTKKTYEITGITVTGNKFTDEKAIIAISGLRTGQKVTVPGSEIPQAIRAVYKQKLFSNVEISFSKIYGDAAEIKIHVTEKPRYSKHSFKGVKKGAHEELNELVNSQLSKNSIVTDDVKENIIYRIKNHYIDKGYWDCRVNIFEFNDEKKENSVRLLIDVDKGPRLKISNITFEGNEKIKSWRLRKKMKETKRVWQVISKSKYKEDLYREDKQKLIDYYHIKGYRDAQIIKDSVWRKSQKRLRIHIVLDEGRRYYFRNIVIKGNSLYTEDQIQNVLSIQKGDVYDQDLLSKRLSFSQDGRDVSSLYMDEGYLFFRAEPVESGIIGDSVDIEIRITEGPPATIDRVIVKGNDRTHEHVVRREVRTRPGQKFSRSDIIRSQRAIMALGFFNPESMGINTPVNPKRGTVDVEYQVEERPSDQLELSAGFSAFGLIGTLGVVFNNFSTRNIFKKSAWNPLPQGDGQKLSLRAQSNGKFFQTYNFSFTEPWLGGKKPNSFTIAASYSSFDQTSIQGGKFTSMRLSSALGSQLRWPDDNFIRSTTMNLERINLVDNPQFGVANGTFYNFSLKHTITRSTVNEPLYPRTGSRLSLSGQLTLPYSLLGRSINYDSISSEERFKWVEYHKWRFDGEWYYNIIDKLVFSFNAKMSFLGYYNKKLGAPPFERVQMGGNGLNNQAFGLLGRDIVSMRGYDVDDITYRTTNDYNNRVDKGFATIFNKFTAELRYPLSLNPSATIFITTFYQAGNSWYSFKEYNPFDLRRAAGVGARVFLPMFGLLGFDYGWGFDKPWLSDQGAPIKSYAQFNFILGFEPD